MKVRVPKKTYKYPGMFIEKSQPAEMPERRPELFDNVRRLCRESH